MTTIVEDVIDLLRGAGFEVREDNPQFAVVGTLGSAAILIEQLLELRAPGVERFHWTKAGMVLDPNGFYVHANKSDDIGATPT